MLEFVKQGLRKIIFRALKSKYEFQGLIAHEKGQNLSVEEAQKLIEQFAKIPSNPYPNKVNDLAQTSLDLSIVIPVYNAEKFLEKCLSSILTQKTDYTYEVICVDDGSTDQSPVILSSIQNQFNSKNCELVVIRQANKGIAGARNTGIEAARGEYIGFMDNDDTVTDNYVDRLLKFAKQENADIVQTGYKSVDEHGNEHFGQVKPYVVSDDKDIIAKYCLGFIWSGVYRKTLWKQIRFPVGYWYEDMITRMMVMRVAKKFVSTGEPLYCKLSHSTNASKVLWNAANPKCIEAFYLAKYSADYGHVVLGLPNDSILMQQLINEYAPLLSSRISDLSETQQKALFTMAAADVCMRFPQNLLNRDWLYTKLYEAFKSNSFSKWKMYSKALYYYRAL
jgi:glycosyltransferase involved in cell wall biosynthesis